MPALSALDINIDREQSYYSGRLTSLSQPRQLSIKFWETFQQKFKRGAKKGHPILQATNLCNILEAAMTV